MYTAELFTGGLPPAELAKRSEQVRKARKGPICKGAGCLTRISAYNLDYKGNPEKRCYKCQHKEDEPVKIKEREKVITAPKGHEDKRVSRYCPRKHDTWILGVRKDGRCLECERLRDRQRYAEQAKDSYTSNYDRVRLKGLKYAMRRSCIGDAELGRKVGVGSRTINDYKHNRSTCTRQDARKIARILRTTLKDLERPSQEVAM